MNSRARPWSARAVLILLAAAITYAQEPPPPSPPPGRTPRPAAPVQREPVHPEALSVQVLPLAHASALEVMQTLRAIQPVLGPGAQVTCDPRTNALIVAGDRETALPQIEKLVQALDREAQPESERTWTGVGLTKARAAHVAEMLNALAPELHGLRYVPDEPGNTIWLMGQPAAVAQLEKLIQEMDARAQAARPTDREGRALRFYPLQQAPAEPVAAVVNQVVASMGWKLRAVPDGWANLVVVHAAPAEHAEIERIIRELDQPPRERPPAREGAPAAGPRPTAPESARGAR